MNNMQYSVKRLDKNFGGKFGEKCYENLKVLAGSEAAELKKRTGIGKVQGSGMLAKESMIVMEMKRTFGGANQLTDWRGSNCDNFEKKCVHEDRVIQRRGKKRSREPDGLLKPKVYMM